MNMSKREAIETAFRKLPLLPGYEPILAGALIFLTDLDTSGPGTRPVQFTVYDSKTLVELKHLEKLACKLADHIEGLHQSSIVAIHDWNTRLEFPTQLRNLGEQAKQASLREEAKLAAASTAPTPSKGGRPEDMRVQIVASMLASFYFKLTGHQPTLRIDSHLDDLTPHGPFFELVEAVFGIIGLKGSTEHAVRKAIQEFKEKTS